MNNLFRKTNCNLCGSEECSHFYTSENFDDKFDIVKCLGCGLIYMNPIYTEEALKNLYQESYYKKTSKFFYFDERENEEIVTKAAHDRLKNIERLIDFKNGRLLDIGCAFGTFLKSVKQVYSNCELHGIDISDYTTQYARDHLELNIFTGPLKSAKYPSEYFDVIVMSGVIEHLSNPLEIMKETNRIMKPGGLAIIDTVNTGSLEAKVFGPKSYIIPGHLHYFSRKTIRNLFSKTNFTIEKIYPTDYNFYLYSLLKVAKRGQKSNKALLRQIIRTLIGNIYLGDLTVSCRMVCYIRKK